MRPPFPIQSRWSDGLSRWVGLGEAPHGAQQGGRSLGQDFLKTKPQNWELDQNFWEFFLLCHKVPSRVFALVCVEDDYGFFDQAPNAEIDNISAKRRKFVNVVDPHIKKD